MSDLEKAQIVELDKRIDARIPTFDLLAAPRDLAIFRLLSAFEHSIQILGSQANLNKRRFGYRLSYNGLNHALRWVSEFCPSTAVESLEIEPSQIVDDATTFLEASEYSQIWAQMSLLHRGRNKAEYLTPNVVRISAATLENPALGAAGNALMHAVDPVDSNDAAALDDETIRLIKRKISVNQIKPGIKYEIPRRLFDLVRSERSVRTLNKKTMNPDWDLGGYTYRQLRSFWLTLETLTLIHVFVVDTSSNEVKKLNFRTRVGTFGEWATRITLWSGIPRTVVEQIITDLTYDQRLHESGQKKVHVMFQPFFPLGVDKLALSNPIVYVSNFERNTWSLVSLLRPKLHDKLKNLKEAMWVDRLSEKVRALGMATLPRIKFVADGEEGEGDLLIIDTKSKTALSCELKWLTSSDDVQGVANDDAQFAKGVRQAVKACNWISTNLEIIAHRISLPVSELRSLEFRPIVISKDSLPSGFFAETGAPVINEKLLEWIINEPHQRDLRSLWQVAQDKAYLPRLGVHYVNFTPEPIQWGDLQFELKDVAFRPMKRWDPKVDISFPE